MIKHATIKDLAQALGISKSTVSRALADHSDVKPETKRLVIWLVLIHNVFNAAAYPFSGALSNGLRAAGDVKFTMYVSVISTIAVRLLLSWLLGIVLKMGVIGIAIAMVCDWSIRAVIFFWRQKSGKWKTFQVI